METAGEVVVTPYRTPLYQAEFETEANDDDDWRQEGQCSQTDPELFFPEQGGSSTREAQKICLGCKVAEQCLEFAIANNEQFGIWGGLTRRERDKWVKQRQKQSSTL